VRPERCPLCGLVKRRTLPQNDAIWGFCRQMSAKLDWYGQTLRPEDWKTMFMAAYRKAKAVPGIDGGFVVLGLSSRELTKHEASDVLELISAFAAERGIELERNEDFD
jgi:hypothetical protein